jgi:hypothetical protein
LSNTLKIRQDLQRSLCNESVNNLSSEPFLDMTDTDNDFHRIHLQERQLPSCLLSYYMLLKTSFNIFLLFHFRLLDVETQIAVAQLKINNLQDDANHTTEK